MATELGLTEARRQSLLKLTLQMQVLILRLSMVPVPCCVCPVNAAAQHQPQRLQQQWQRWQQQQLPPALHSPSEPSLSNTRKPSSSSDSSKSQPSLSISNTRHSSSPSAFTTMAKAMAKAKARRLLQAREATQNASANAAAPAPSTSSSDGGGDSGDGGIARGSSRGGGSISSSSSSSGSSSGSGVVEHAAAAAVWWNPPDSTKFLLALCVYGRLSNQEQCMETQLRLAAILNRTLLVPNIATSTDHPGPGSHWRWDVAVDWARVAACLAPAHGPETIIMLDDFLTAHGLKSLTLQRMHCLQQHAEDCVPRKSWGALRALNGTLILPRSLADSVEVNGTAQATTASGPIQVSAADVLARFGRVVDKVICLGEVLHVTISPAVTLTAAADGCSNLWRPHTDIIKFVDGMIGTTLGTAYAAAHVRRGDFYNYAIEHANLRNISEVPYTSMPQVAADISRLLQPPWNRGRNSSSSNNSSSSSSSDEEGSRFSLLFVASNARRMESDMLRTLLTGRGFPTVVNLQMLLHDDLEGLRKEEWASGFVRLIDDGEGEVAQLLADKYLCARANAFLGTCRSTFSLSISRIRVREGYNKTGEKHHKVLDNCLQILMPARRHPR